MVENSIHKNFIYSVDKSLPTYQQISGSRYSKARRAHGCSGIVKIEKTPCPGRKIPAGICLFK